MNRTSFNVTCNQCGEAYPEDGLPYRCPYCGGLFDFGSPPPFDSDVIEPEQPGIWRYRRMFGLPEDAPPVSLGEGSTPLVWAKSGGREVAFKCEYLNPTGSFKDRGAATLVSMLMVRGVHEAVEDSSGNAGAAFAAYAARAGIRARVYVPEAASGPKRAQIAAYGAEVIAVPGPRSAAAEAVRKAAEEGAVYASHAYLPFDLPGYASIAFELYETLGGAPGAVVMPVGQGALLLGVWRGFQALVAAGRLKSPPRLIGVQARACAPLWAAFTHGEAAQAEVREEPTLAEGVRIRHPLRAEAVLGAVRASGGHFVAAREEEIRRGRDQLARRGLYVEPTSALVWQALEEMPADVPDPVVAILTGSGLKAG